MRYLKISELAKEAGIKSTAIRYYEKIGIFPRPLLNGSGYRQYDEKALKIARFIVHAKELGFSLKEIAELLSLKLNEKNSCEKVKTMAEIKIKDMDRRISSLNKLKRKLTNLKRLCENKEQNDNCPILDILDEY